MSTQRNANAPLAGKSATLAKTADAAFAAAKTASPPSAPRRETVGGATMAVSIGDGLRTAFSTGQLVVHVAKLKRGKIRKSGPIAMLLGKLG